MTDIYLQGIADIENNTAKELTKLGAVIQVPFRAGNQFLGEGGLQVGIGCRVLITSLAERGHRTFTMGSERKLGA